MTKDDLKTGMVVRLRHDKDNLYMVYRNVPGVEYCDMFVNTSGWLNFDEYTDDLLAREPKYDISDLVEWDIIEVYAPMVGASLQNNRFETDLKNWFRSIWKREESDEKSVEMTVDQIKEKLGVDNLKIIM